MKEELTLKWGTVKGWNNLSEQSVAIMKRYFADGMPISAMGDRPTPERRAILCELIDQIDGEIINDWEGEAMTKDSAKSYVLSYGEKK